MTHLIRGFICAALIVGITQITAVPAAALAGPCSANRSLYFSVICQTSGHAEALYAEWPSVPLNITQASANSGQWISEAMWVYHSWVDGQTQYAPWLELGDTAGGGAGTGGILGHQNEWARMWYWVDGTQGACCGVTSYFIAYAPNDSVSRAWGIQYDTALGSWGLYIGGVKYVTVTYFPNPNTMTNMRLFQGMEVNNGGTIPPPALNASKNSGLFTVRNMNYRDCCTWLPLISPTIQVDAPCGTSPTCLQGWWTSYPRDWNNAKP